ncbi:MAG: hypothetical protein IKF60_08940 [Solobacterium sp.]|nr:hypothetical protein [Solobacterium sp.]
MAACLLENGVTVFISFSSATLAMVRQLSPDLHMQVLTNGMHIAGKLQFTRVNNKAMRSLTVWHGCAGVIASLSLWVMKTLQLVSQTCYL